MENKTAMANTGVLDEARAFHMNGRLVEAESLYRQVLEQDPDSLRALEGLGVLLFQQGRAGQAATFFARGVALRPSAALFQANLGEALRTLGQFDQALEHLHRAVILQPALAQAWNSLGLLAFDQGRLDDGESAYQEAIKAQPQFVAAHINLANIHLTRRRWQDAEVSLRAALRLEPDNVLALTNLGQILSEMGDLERLPEAESLCRRAADLAGNLAPVHDSLGNILRIQGRLDEALACHQRSLKINPRSALPQHYIGRILEMRGRYEEAARYFEAARALQPRDPRFHLDFADMLLGCRRHDESIPHYRAALACKPDSAEAHYGSGLARLEQGQLDQAETSLREALRIDPALALAWTGLARIQAERGDVELSCESARAALAIRPNLTEAYWRLAVNLRGRLTAGEALAIERLLEQKLLPANVRATLHFSMAMVLDAQGQYSRAAQVLETAHALQAKSRADRGEAHDPDRHARFIDRLIAAFTRDVIVRCQAWGDPDPRPVFIVGLPRSGTTLVEQILAAHPAVHGAGELFDLHKTFKNLHLDLDPPASDPFEAVRKLTPSSVQKSARRYLDRLTEIAPEAERVVDKMPDNARLLGLIAILFPKAKIIVCHRDLRDVAISCRQTGFTTNLWTNDWDHIAQRFADHQRIIEHWRQTAVIPWLDVRYEDLVRDFENHARRLIDFIGLDWNPACLDFHSSRNVVRTASLIQIREPVHERSVARWKHYESSLGALLQAFDRYGVDVEDGR
jgi:tetratricopeptide (TPR) repeat protein